MPRVSLKMFFGTFILLNAAVLRPHVLILPRITFWILFVIHVSPADF